jgi:hypothetical protein
VILPQVIPQIENVSNGGDRISIDEESENERCHALRYLDSVARVPKPVPAGTGVALHEVMRNCLVYALTISMGFAAAAFGQTPAAERDALRVELQRLREEFDQIRQQYTERLNALEVRLTALNPGSETPPAALPQTASVPAAAAGEDTPTGTLPVYGNVTALSKIFDPDLAVIGNFLGAAGGHRQDSRPPLELREVETALQAVVDPYARADFFFGFSPEGVEIEEGYLTFSTVPGGLLAKAGKFRSAVGRVNTMHAHTLPWIDRPIVTQNLAGGDEGLTAPALSLARLLPNPWVFVELTGEVSATDSQSDLGYVARARRDISDSTNLDLGFSFASSDTSLIAFDGTIRYRPLRRAIYRRFLARTELLWRREAIGETAFGTYLAAEYQLARRWFAGGRWDYSRRALDRRAADSGASWLLTFWPSEFTQIRWQYRHTKYAEGVTANDLLLQVLFAIGVHGAHAF